MNPELLEDVLSCPSLPSLPAVAAQVIELTSNENVVLDDLAGVIKADQGLSTKILRTVNSSFYGLRQPCTTIEKALVMLGLGPVKTLALGFSLVSAVDTDSKGSFDYEGYWRRGLDTAVAAKCIADAAELDCADEAFLAGLLHDIGMVALYRALDRSYLDILESVGAAHDDLCRAELSVLELQHPEIGAMLAERWKLPPQLSIPIRYHARPTASPIEHATLSRVVAAGNSAHEVLASADASKSLSVYYQRLHDWFDLDHDAADEILKRISEDSRQLADLFSLQPSDNIDTDAILADAKKRITEITKEQPRETYGVGRFEGVIQSPQSDPLTGAVNRAGFTDFLAASFQEVAHSMNPLSLVVVGVDGIVETARVHGTQPADDVVVSTVATLNTHFEPLGGIVCRLGTTSFGVILPGTGRRDAAVVTEQFRDDVATNAGAWLPPTAAGPTVTVSAGIATATKESVAVYGTPKRFVAAANKALEAARNHGGNTVRAFQPKAAA